MCCGNISAMATSPIRRHGRGAMAEALIDRLSNERYNFIIEGTLRTSSAPLRTARLLRGRGYGGVAGADGSETGDFPAQLPDSLRADETGRHHAACDRPPSIMRASFAISWPILRISKNPGNSMRFISTIGKRVAGILAKSIGAAQRTSWRRFSSASGRLKNKAILLF